jgi:uncharacterized protein YbjT (DUF2867 family)
MQKKAIIIGSTGLIGNYLLEFLLQDDDYEQIIALVRKPTKSNNKRLIYIETDFKNLEAISSNLNGDYLFICIGSTMAKAGSKESFLKIDYNIPVDVAHIAINNGVKNCIAVSSLGADAFSNNFYLQTKGKMEIAIEKLAFNKIIFMRPSLLFGDRKEFRFGELLGKFVMKLIGPFFIGVLKKYRGIQAKTVAKAMQIAAQQEIVGVKKYESDQIELLVKNNVK